MIRRAVKITKLAGKPAEVFARGKVMQQAIEAAMAADEAETSNEFLGPEENEDRVLDTTISSYEGFEPGQVVYYENMFAWNDFSEQVVVGFTPLLCVGNEHVKEPFRRMLVASVYKGKLEVHSQPMACFTAQPKWTTPPVCVYCHRNPSVKGMQGACFAPRCQLRAMRDSL